MPHSALRTHLVTVDRAKRNLDVDWDAPRCVAMQGCRKPHGHERRVSEQLPSSVSDVVRNTHHNERPRTATSGGGGIRTHERVSPLHAFEF